MNLFRAERMIIMKKLLEKTIKRKFKYAEGFMRILKQSKNLFDDKHDK